MKNIYPISPRKRTFVLPNNMCMAYPSLKNRIDRKKSIVNNTKSVFVVRDNLNANSSKPFYELCKKNTVLLYSSHIKILAFRYDLDEDLVKAIMFMETTHGWYDKFSPQPISILPMNIHFQYWEELGYSKQQLLNPKTNIEAGIILLSRIQERLEDSKIAKIASVYNFLGAERVTDFGARVRQIYREKAWLNCSPEKR